jgi:hypothetical protein
MTLSEFRAWFEGFTESQDGPPNAKAWKRIKERVAEISGAPITERIFVDRYRDYLDWPDTRRPYRAYGIGYSAGSVSLQNGVGNAVLTGATDSALCTSERASAGTPAFNSHAAMADLGRAEALASSARPRPALNCPCATNQTSSRVRPPSNWRYAE